MGKRRREKRVVYGLVVMGQGEWNSAGRDYRASWDGSFEVDERFG